MKKSVFTICAKNYIGLAQILEKSIKETNPQLDFFIFVADEFEEYPCELPSNVYISRKVLNIDDSLWEEMSFKYDITEFCTSIKPKCFEYIFETGYDKVSYLDPDILVFNSLDIIFDLLNKYEIVLVPHITQMQEKYTGDLPEKSFLYVGSYNLGFCAVKKSENSKKIIAWWHNRLIDKCFSNPHEHYFTDQCWMNMLPCFLSNEKLYIFRHIGVDVAPWNYCEREIVLKDSKLYVKLRNQHDDTLYDLIFVHFSGYDYKKLKEGIVIQRDVHVKEYSDISVVINIYKESLFALRENFDKYLNLPYSYNFFDNGMPILLFHRRLYNGFIKKGYKYDDLFKSDGKQQSFYGLLKKRKLILPSSFSRNPYAKIKRKNKKIQIVNFFLYLLYRILGCKRFLLLIQSFNIFAQYEHYTFLLEKNTKSE